jgi:hypothetical protein
MATTAAAYARSAPMVSEYGLMIFAMASFSPSRRVRILKSCWSQVKSVDRAPMYSSPLKGSSYLGSNEGSRLPSSSRRVPGSSSGSSTSAVGS